MSRPVKKRFKSMFDAPSRTCQECRGVVESGLGIDWLARNKSSSRLALMNTRDVESATGVLRVSTVVQERYVKSVPESLTHSNTTNFGRECVEQKQKRCE